MNQPTILDEIVVSKRQQIEIQKESMPQSSLESVARSDRDFAGALRSANPAFILECKKASPSRGLIREDFDLLSIASVYSKYATAISVLTESEYFQGSLSNLGIVRSRASQPLLAKDFFVEPYQVYQARHFGADAILLILAILDDQQWTEMFQLARTLGMDVVTEVSNAEEQQRAIALKAPIVGINNRNLRDMSIDLETTRQLSSGLADDTIVISESGYHTHRQVRAMSDCANGFLIGSSLMSEKRLATAVKRIMFGDCKVCGLTRNEDAIAADDAGAVYGGVIFAESSPRKIDCEDVETIFQNAALVRVGVFQDHSLDQIIDSASRCRLDVIQLHGDESVDFVQQLRSHNAFDLEIWKALGVKHVGPQADQWFGAGVDKLVVDHQIGGQKGGTGKAFDWDLLPVEQRDRIMVAGGIGPENVKQAVQLGCCGIDMNSKLEEGPGSKCSVKIKDAFQRIRDYQISHG